MYDKQFVNKFPVEEPINTPVDAFRARIDPLLQ